MIAGCATTQSGDITAPDRPMSAPGPEDQIHRSLSGHDFIRPFNPKPLLSQGAFLKASCLSGARA